MKRTTPGKMSAAVIFISAFFTSCTKTDILLDASHFLSCLPDMMKKSKILSENYKRNGFLSFTLFS